MKISELNPRTITVLSALDNISLVGNEEDVTKRFTLSASMFEPPISAARNSDDSDTWTISLS